MGALFPAKREVFPGFSPAGAGVEAHRVEYVLSKVRVVLALSVAVAIYYDATQPARYVAFAEFLLLIYLGYALGLYVAIRRRTVVPGGMSLFIHGSDILFPGLVSLFTNGHNSPFFLFFGFGLLAAAFRWGLNNTLFTGFACIAMLLLAEIAHRYGLAPPWIQGHYDLDRLIMRASYLAIFAFLAGYLAEQERRVRSQAVALSRVSSKARFEAGLKGSLRAVLSETVQQFRAKQALLVFDYPHGTFLWKAGPECAIEGLVLTALELDASERSHYLFPVPADTLRLSRTHRGRPHEAVSDVEGAVVHSCPVPDALLCQHPFAAALVSCSTFEPNVSARLLLLEPHSGLDPKAEIRFLRDLTRHVAPAVYNVYLLRRLRTRAAADERARVARDLHDGVIQSLHAIAFRLYALRMESRLQREFAGEVLNIQQLVQQEASNLRQLIEQLKPLDFDPSRFIEWLSVTVDRFRQDSGIAARFLSDVPVLTLPPKVAYEMAQVVREALLNIARHSEAAHVVVRLSAERDTLRLVIDDDGRGFGFVGRLSPDELENSRHGPQVIKERLRAIGAQLTIVSRPGRGARLEIVLPQHRAVPHAS